MNVKFRKVISSILVVVMLLSLFAVNVFAKNADSYTVLMLDTSNSMSGEPIEALKDVAKRFCASLLGADGLNQIAIIEYNTEYTASAFTDDYSAMKNKIDSIAAGGNTNMYAALLEANNLLAGTPSGTVRNLVVLTDGVPQSGTSSSEGPYNNLDDKNILSRIYKNYANAVYNLMESYKADYDIYTIGFFHKSSSTLAQTLLGDINNQGYYNAQNTDELAFMFSKIADGIKKTVPKTYDFFNDSYNFENYNSTISNEYFETMYGYGKGFSLWKNNAYSRGVCFGMAYTTAALFNGLPECESIRGLLNKRDPSELYSLYSTVKIGNKTIGLHDYILYDFIYQFSDEFDSASTWSDINTIYNKVKMYLDNDQIGVTIGMTRKDEKGGHRVLAVGIDGNDILIDDPNNKDDYARITVGSNGDWTFSGLNGWNNNTCYIRYSCDYYTPYQLLLTGKTATPDADGRDSYVDGMDLLSQDKLLFTTDCNSCDFSASEYTPIFVDAVSEESSQIKQYWIKDENTVTISNIFGDDNSFSLAGNDAIITASSKDASEITLTVDEDNNNIDTNISAIPGHEYSVEYVFFNDDKDALQITVSGTANSEEVSAIGANGGLLVNGLNNINVEYRKNDEDMNSVTAKIVDGRDVNITINENEEKVVTDFIDENEVEPDKPEPEVKICKYCGKVHGSSLWEQIVAFFHNIFWFFKNLFKA